jgi:hypothetical protein
VGKGPCAFKETDVRRAVKAVVAAGQPIAGIRFNKDGGFTVLTGEPVAAENLKANPWDEAVYNDDENQKRAS